MRLYSKTDKVKSLLVEGNFLKALSIVKSFRIGFSKEEKRSIEIAYESLSGHSKFYQALGIDTELEIEKSHSILQSKFLQ